jgi:hypothetical protein
MTYLQQLLEAHPEFVLACEADRARLVQAFAVEFPIDHMTAVLLGSTTAVLKVARAEGAIVSTANMLELAERVTRNSVQTVIAMLLDVNPPTREDRASASVDLLKRTIAQGHDRRRVRELFVNDARSRELEELDPFARQIFAVRAAEAVASTDSTPCSRRREGRVAR